MKKLLLILSSIGIILLCMGSCIYFSTVITNREYTYTTPTIEIEEWKVQAKLDPTWQSHNSNQDLENPYRLLLWIESPIDSDPQFNSLEVRIVAIFNANGRNVTTLNAAQIISCESTRSGDYFFLSKGFQIANHETIRIVLELFVLDDEGNEIDNQEFELDFDPLFREYKSNRVIDGILSA